MVKSLRPVANDNQHETERYLQKPFHNPFKINHPVYCVIGVIELPAPAPSDYISSLDSGYLFCGEFFQGIVVESSRESLEAGINTPESHILVENISAELIQLASSSVTLNALLNAFDECAGTT